MAFSAQQAEAFNDQNAHFFANRTEYKKGALLVVYWLEHDLDLDNHHAAGHTLSTELEALRTFFESSLNFEIFDCALPSAVPEDKWGATIGSVLRSLQLEESHILVLLYAGHNEVKDEEAELAAFVATA